MANEDPAYEAILDGIRLRERLRLLDALARREITVHVSDAGGQSYSNRVTGQLCPLVTDWALPNGLAKVTGGHRIRLTDAGREAARVLGEG